MERNDADYTIIFDGGSRGNPGEGYGSYELRTRAERQIERLTFGDHVTNNEAEYRTLIAALRDVLASPHRVRRGSESGHARGAGR